MTARAAITARAAGIPEPAATVGIPDDLLAVIALGHKAKAIGLVPTFYGFP